MSNRLKDVHDGSSDMSAAMWAHVHMNCKTRPMCLIYVHAWVMTHARTVCSTDLVYAAWIR